MVGGKDGLKDIHIKRVYHLKLVLQGLQTRLVGIGGLRVGVTELASYFTKLDGLHYPPIQPPFASDVKMNHFIIENLWIDGLLITGASRVSSGIPYN